MGRRNSRKYSALLTKEGDGLDDRFLVEEKNGGSLHVCQVPWKSEKEGESYGGG